MLNSDFLEKGLGIVFLLYFVYDFSRKKVSHVNTLLIDQRLPLLLELLVNTFIAIVC